MFSSRFMLFPTLNTNLVYKKNSGGGGGDVDFFLEKQILSHFTFYAIFNIKKYWNVPIHLLVKWEVVSPNSREGQLESISIISSITLFWFCISNVGWFGVGGCNVFLTFYAISNISRRKNLGIQTNYFSFNVFLVFFLYAGNIEKCPFTYSYWLKPAGCPRTGKNRENRENG